MILNGSPGPSGPFWKAWGVSGPPGGQFCRRTPWAHSCIKMIGTVDEINLVTLKGFYSKSRKSKNSNKSQKLYTIVHLPARIDAILKKIILTLQAASVRTHFRGGVMGSNADFMENGLKPKEYACPSNSSKIKNRHESFLNPTKSHENKTPRVYFHPASIGDGPRPPQTLKTAKKQIFDKIRGPWGARSWVSQWCCFSVFFAEAAWCVFFASSVRLWMDVFSQLMSFRRYQGGPAKGNV